jgi:hypothetical protein
MPGSSQLAINRRRLYGLSSTAYLCSGGIEFRIFGNPMHSWRACMPAGHIAVIGGLHLDPV